MAVNSFSLGEESLQKAESVAALQAGRCSPDFEKRFERLLIREYLCKTNNIT